MRFTTALSMIIAALAVAAAPATRAEIPRINRYATTDRSFSTNAYWLESEQGIVAVDALMLKSDAAALAAVIRSRGKPLVAVLLTHPHGDHFGGVPTLRKAFPELQLVATRATADLIAPAQKRSLQQNWINAYGDDFERGAISADRIVEDGAVVELAGMHFRFSDMGAMETGNNTLIENVESGALFSGDATVAHAAYFIGEGHSRLALQGLREIRKRYRPDMPLYSGHYEPMRLAAVVDDNIAQVQFMRETMRAALSDANSTDASGALTDAARDRLSREVAKRLDAHADYGLGQLTVAESLNLPRLELEIRAELAAARNAAKDAQP